MTDTSKNPRGCGGKQLVDVVLPSDRSLRRQHDRDLVQVEHLHGLVMVRLRTLQHGGAKRDTTEVREALQALPTGS